MLLIPLLLVGAVRLIEVIFDVDTGRAVTAANRFDGAMAKLDRTADRLRARMRLFRRGLRALAPTIAQNILPVIGALARGFGATLGFAIRGVIGSVKLAAAGLAAFGLAAGAVVAGGLSLLTRSINENSETAKRLRDVQENLGDRMREALAPAVSRVANAFIAFISNPVIANGLVKLGEAFGSVFEFLVRVSLTALEKVTQAFAGTLRFLAGAAERLGFDGLAISLRNTATGADSVAQAFANSREAMRTAKIDTDILAKSQEGQLGTLEALLKRQRELTAQLKELRGPEGDRIRLLTEQNKAIEEQIKLAKLSTEELLERIKTLDREADLIEFLRSNSDRFDLQVQFQTDVQEFLDALAELDQLEDLEIKLDGFIAETGSILQLKEVLSELRAEYEITASAIRRAELAKAIKETQDEIDAISATAPEGSIKQLTATLEKLRAEYETTSDAVRRAQLAEAILDVQARLDAAAAQLEEKILDIGSNLQTLATSLAGSLANAFANQDYSNLGAEFLSALASFADQVGKTLIGFGVGGRALKFFANRPGLAIAAGIGLVALAARLRKRVERLQDQGVGSTSTGGSSLSPSGNRSPVPRVSSAFEPARTVAALAGRVPVVIQQNVQVENTFDDRGIASRVASELRRSDERGTD